MKITVLIENTSVSENLAAEHGFSLFIETDKHKIICDCGQTDAIIRNADVIGADIKNADTVILSHAHYDHSGGIMALSEVNKTANIYIPPYSDCDYYDTDGKYIGIDKNILNLSNIKITNEYTVVDGEITVFGNISERKLFPFGNSRLLKKCDCGMCYDDFLHEQYTVINSGVVSVLISGCAHNGIVNILNEYIRLFGKAPDAVISGFHLMKRTEYTEKEIEFIKETAYELMKYNTVFYTGHCTGRALSYLSQIMGDRLIQISTGSIFNI